MALLSLSDRMDKEMELILSIKKGDFVRLTSALDSLNPMSVIKRGYSAVYDDDNNLVKSVDQIDIGNKINFKLSDGCVIAAVEEIRHE
jgi:exodeoxyribonuclease VII large subunit